MSGNYLRKCPFCSCFLSSRKDLKAHAKALHSRDIDDVPPYSLIEEVSKRFTAKYIYKYRPSKTSRCELCGSRKNIYDVGLENGAVLHRCQTCLTDMMEHMKNVRFVRVDANESVRGCERKIGEMDRYSTN